MLTFLFKFLSFYSAGTESGKAENNGLSPQKRKTESSEKDSSEPKEKKSFSMSVQKPVIGISMSIGAKKPTQLGAGESKQGISINKKGMSMKPAPIKMALTGQPKDSSIAVKPLSEKIASVFNDDSEEEEMPPEAKMKMRNVGRETPTAAGPNSYGKNNLGFCDRNKMIEREYKQKLLELSESEHN